MITPNGESALRRSWRGIRTELAGGFRVRKWSGLIMVFAGILFVCVSGVFLGMLIHGESTGLQLTVTLLFGAALMLSGNLIWQRARQRSRRSQLRRGHPKGTPI
jgi:drug/metabolite transporter (DMT)-like permease